MRGLLRRRRESELLQLSRSLDVGLRDVGAQAATRAIEESHVLQDLRRHLLDPRV